MTQEELQELCALWQQRLRLQDWDVEVSLVRHWDLEADRIGSVKRLLVKKTAKITILHRQDVGPECWPYEDEETSLVHELLHCLLMPCEPDEWDSPAGIAMEQAIHAMAHALVAGYRSEEMPA